MKLYALIERLDAIAEEHGDITVVLGAGCWYGLASRVNLEAKPAGMHVYVTSEECH